MIPVFVIYELIIRLSEIEPGIGDYISGTHHDEGIIIKLSNGTLFIPDSVLQMQFKDPELLNKTDLLQLLTQYKKNPV